MLPELLAISANSPFLDGRDTGLASAGSQIFTRSFPRCGIPVRPHYAFGTVEVRIADAQTRAQDSEALAAVTAAAITQAALDHDEGISLQSAPGRLVEETLWRAIRHGLDGQDDRPRAQPGVPVRGAAGATARLDHARPRGARNRPQLPVQNGAQRQRRALLGGDPIDEIYAAELYDTQSSYGNALDFDPGVRA